MNPVRENRMWHTYLLQSLNDDRWDTDCTDDLRDKTQIVEKKI